MEIQKNKQMLLKDFKNKINTFLCINITLFIINVIIVYRY